MKKSYKVNDMIYTLKGNPYDSTLSYDIVSAKTNKSIELNSLNPYQRSLLCMCHENFNSGDNTDLQENRILIIETN
nr:hypothetical protein [uncultured Aminipila sp.]